MGEKRNSTFPTITIRHIRTLVAKHNFDMLKGCGLRYRHSSDKIYENFQFVSGNIDVVLCCLQTEDGDRSGQIPG